ncbi:MAG: MraY family glycosyltransferase [Acidimicrobiales bacterium]
MALGLAALVITAALVPLVRRIAVHRGITDHPKDGRWHTTPTPYLGGVAIATAAVLCGAFAPQWEGAGFVLLLAALAVGVLGLADDIRPLHPVLRLVVEGLAATAAFSVDARVHLIGGPGDYIVTVLAIVFVTNAFNLLDNVDGALGAVVTIIAVALTVAALLEHQVLVGALAAVVAGACLGFLVHNWHPASIFMGDAGSLFLGFLLAAIALKLRTAVSPVPSAIAVVLLLGAALFDTTLVAISRVRAGRSVLLGGTDHTSHRLLRGGLSSATVTIVLAAGAAYSAAWGVLVARGLVPVLIGLVVTTLPGVAALAALLRVPVYEPGVDQSAAVTLESTSSASTLGEVGFGPR